MAMALAAALCLAASFPAAAEGSPLDAARRALDAGRAAEARRLLDAWIAANPSDPSLPEAELLAALTEDRASEVARRLAHLATSQPAAPAGVEATLLLAESAVARGQSLGEADAERMRVLSEGRAAPEQRRRALALLAESATATRDLAEARQSWRRLLELDPAPEERARASVRLAAIERALGRPDEEAGVLREAARGKAGASGAGAALWWNLARAAEAAGDTGEVAEAERELAARFPRAPESGTAEPAERAPSGGAPGMPWTAPTGEGDAWVVRCGRFTEPVAAEALREAWEEASGERMQVVALDGDPGRWAVETGGFPDRASAARFAQWLEEEGGFVAWVEAR